MLSDDAVLAAITGEGDADLDALADEAAIDETALGETADDDAIKTLLASVSDKADIEAEDLFPEADVATGAAANAEAGDYFRDCADCPDMAMMPAGKFRMGAKPGEVAQDLAEGPARDVNIARGFALGAREVTFDEWQACVTAGACSPAPDHGWGRGERPVVSVSYNDAQAYVAWLSIKTGQRYRLPSEAEWEYAARGGNDSAFSFGPVVSVAKANFNGEYPYGGRKETFRARTMPTGSFAPNAFGLFDMHGNAWEWTSDCWNPTHAGAPADGSAIASGDCTRRVLKGGAWNTGGWRLRSAHRIGKPATAREFDNGFRVAREL